MPHLDKRRMLLIAACLAVFLLLLYQIGRPAAPALDAATHALIVEGLRAPWLTPVMEGFSALVSPVVIAVILLIVAACSLRRRLAWCCALNVGLAALLNVALKTLVQRPRPEGFRLIEETGFSFPSGHAMAAMAFFGLIIWFIWHFERSRPRRAMLTAALSLVILMIGVSRIYLGVHYASDVVAGFCVSLIWLALFTRFAARPLLG